MKTLRLTFVFLLVFMGNLSHAADNEEINYLLSYLGDSGCTFIRNGSEHRAQEARDHLEMKYNHAKGRIKTAEDFIDKLASQSSLSRKPYEVRCADVQLPSKQWLDEALAFHRASSDKQKQED